MKNGRFLSQLKRICIPAELIKLRSPSVCTHKKKLENVQPVFVNFDIGNLYDYLSIHNNFGLKWSKNNGLFT